MNDILLLIYHYLVTLDPAKIGFIVFGIIFFMVITKAHKRRKLDWTDLITAKNTNKVSLTKMLQLIGGITGTLIVIYQTVHDKLTFDIFLSYLAYVGSQESWSKFVAARYGGISAQDTVEKVIAPDEHQQPSNVYGPKVPGTL